MTWLAGPAFRRGLGVAIIVGTILAMFGTPGRTVIPLWIRLPYWIGLAVAGTMIGTAANHMASERLDLDNRPWLSGLATIALLALPMTLIVWVATDLIFRQELMLSHLPEYLFPVVILSAALTALNLLVQRAPEMTRVQSPDQPVLPVRFLDRLPARLKGASLIAVSSEDHYLRLHTDRGQDLILLRLSDAIEELKGLEGARVHRSWWVAREAVVSARRQEGRAILQLQGGLQVPVSRNYIKALREAGWF